MPYALEELIGMLLSRNAGIEEEVKKNAGLQDLSYKQWECISWIRTLNNPNLTELSIRLKITKPSTTALIDKLEEKKYITKVKSDADRRTAHVHLTRKGYQASQVHQKAHLKLAHELSKQLSPEENEKFLNLLNKALHPDV